MTGEKRVTEDAPDDDLLDGCDELVEDVDDVELIALFAEANDPASPVTVAEVEAQWAAIREEGGL